MQNNDELADIFGTPYKKGDVILYAKHGGIQTVYRVIKINKSTITALPIRKHPDGKWRELGVTKSVLNYPTMGYIISTDVFPYTETPWLAQPAQSSSGFNYIVDDDDDDDDD